MSDTDFNLYGNSATSVDLKTYNQVVEPDGKIGYQQITGDLLGAQRLFTQVQVLEVGAATGTGASGSSVPAGEGYTNTADKDATVHLLVDTGSWATVIPLAIIQKAMPDFDPSGYPAAHLEYNSSDVGINGVWVPIKLQFTTTDGSTAITTVPVLVDTDASPAYMMGVGFDIGLHTPSIAQDISTANNAFLNLQGMQAGTMTAGYVIDTSGIHLGLSAADVGSGWAFQKLQASTNQEPSGAPLDWQPATIGGSVNGVSFPDGQLLVDTGLANSYLETTDPFAPAGTGTLVTLNLLGTSGAVSYSYVLGGNSSQAPTRGSLSPALLTKGSDFGTFINTGGHFLSGFDYLFDAANGYVGIRQNQSGENTNITFSPLISVSGTIPLPDGFATSLPLLLTGDTTLVLVGTATLSGGLTGSGTLTISGGNVEVSGASTLSGTVALTTGATLTVQSANALGAAGNAIDLAAGTTLTLADGVTLAQSLHVTGSATLDVGAGTQATLAGSIEDAGDSGLDLTIAGGGTLSLTGNVSGYVNTITLQDTGTTLAAGHFNDGGPDIILGDGTTLKVMGSTDVTKLSASGNSTLDIAAGATLHLSFGYGDNGSLPAHITVTGGGTVAYANGSEHGIPLATGHGITIGTKAELNGDTIAGFTAGDLIDVTDLDPTSKTVTATYDAASGALVLRANGQVVSDLLLPSLAASPGGSNVTVTTDGARGALIGLTPATGDGGDQALQGPQARAAGGVDGTGVVVGVISDSFNTLGGMAQDELNGELPSGTRVLSDASQADSDEGREMAQLIHRIAPGASILFAASGTATDPNAGATSSNSEQHFANAINLLVKNGARVIVDDIRVYQEADWQPGGIAAQAIAAATANGVVFVTSAGNSGKAYYEHDLVLSQASLPGLGQVSAFDFNLGQGTPSYFQHVTSTSSSHTLDLQWALPQGSSAYQLALNVFTGDGSGGYVPVDVEVHHSGTYESVSFSGVSDFYVAITSTDPNATGLLKYIVINDGRATIDDPNAGQGDGTIFGHKLDANEITVGAVNYASTPSAGVAVPVNEVFSSYGSGEYLFDASGNALATPEVLAKPDVSGVDGVATDASGSSTVFDGTSAAAPSVAAVVALMLQANKDLSTGQVRTILAASALPMPGATLTAGAGLVQADVAVALARVPALQSVTATADGGPPALGIGRAVTFTLDAGTALTVTPGPDGSLPTLSLNDGGVAMLDPIASAAGGLVFRTTVTAGQSVADLAVTALVLNGATITNAGGLVLAAMDVSVLPGASTGLSVDTTTSALTLALSSDGTLSGAPPLVSGTAEAGATVTVTLAGQTRTGTVAADGTWSLALPPSTDGSLVLTATATDVAGNQSAASLPLTVAGGLAGTVRKAASGQTLQAGDGPDTLVANGTGTHLVGGGGHSTLLGSPVGATTLTGGAGGSLMVAQGGATVIQGGPGRDTVQATHGDVDCVRRGRRQPGHVRGRRCDLCRRRGGHDRRLPPARPRCGRGRGSLMSLGSGSAVVVAGSGTTVVGGAGPALIAAAGGSSTVFAGSGQTVFIGGNGNSLLAAGTGSTTVYGGAGGGLFAGGTGGNNVLLAGQGATTLFGGGNGDVLFAAGSAGDLLVAGAGNETLQGAYSMGDNTYFAGSGQVLIGLGAGRDHVVAGAGASTVVAGTGADTFTFTRGSAGGTQTIAGFKVGTDRLDLQGYASGEVAEALASTTGTTITLSDNTRISLTGLGSLDTRIF